jgi:hypothetical protein
MPRGKLIRASVTAVSQGRRGRRAGNRSGAVAAALAGPLLAANGTLFLSHVLQRRRIPRLAAVSTAGRNSAARLPAVTVVMPARDEAHAVRASVDSLLRQDHPDLRLVLVDDRSTDGTGRIMAELVAAHPDRVRVLSVQQLPPGWLGKNHALWLGASRAEGDWLLFTDADVIFEPTCVRRAVAYAVGRGLDHLTLFTGLVTPGYWLQAFIAFYQYAALSSQLAYLATYPRTRVGVGLGAFNLIHRTAYERAGTFAAVSLRPDEDMRFGARVKRAGLRQGVLCGVGLLRQEWYPSLGTALAGLEKGLFAGLGYSVPRVAGVVGALLLLAVCPYLLVWRAAGRARWWLVGAITLHSAGVVAVNRQLGSADGRVVPALPVAAVLFCYAVMRSCARALVAGGVRWRRTFYPLAQLRGQTGLEDLP